MRKVLLDAARLMLRHIGMALVRVAKDAKKGACPDQSRLKARPCWRLESVT